MSIVKNCAVIASVLLLAGCASPRGTSPQGLELPIEKAAVNLVTDTKNGGYRIVTTNELKKWLDEGRKMIIINSLLYNDSRVLGTIPGSVNASLPESEQELTPEDREHLSHAAGGNKESLLVVYCGFVACRNSHIGAKLLVDDGYKNVYRYPAGVIGWAEAGNSVKK
jgi:rhodanese-related sulfurtransferase